MEHQKITIPHCRLSNEDALDGESNRIANQKAILTKYATERGFKNLRVLVDDGYSGTNFNRPGIREALSLAERGLAGTFVVKDASRFGRDYLQAGNYTELVFPSCDVRFIAANDNADSATGDNDFTPFRNFGGNRRRSGSSGVEEHQEFSTAATLFPNELRTESGA
ncbi:MAG: recombinase family protein [Oscillibacter sp.]|nr:recombinase family protein [Oscillibacter sp.]